MSTPSTAERIKQLFHAAVERDPHEWSAFLDVSCPDNLPLRKEVETLLALSGRHEFLAKPVFELSAAEVAEQVLKQDDESSSIGQRIGAYRLIREIGRGGMGAVYLAVRNDDEYEKQVAIKLIKRGMDSDLIQSRFRNERQILANLDHPNIARLFDGGTTEDGRAFLVMEYIEGQPIDVYADTHKLSTTERLKMFLIVCDAVQYAHVNQVIHRDLKPGNILVNHDGVPKLLDFGIAKVLTSETADATTSAWRILTPEYASPEQIQSGLSGVTSDVYSLGAVLYELLTGHRARRGPVSTAITPEPEKPSAVVFSWREDRQSAGATGRPKITPDTVSETRDCTPERLRRSLRGDLDNIVLTALRREPERRYASVAEFSADIRRHLERRPVRARKDSLFYRGRKFLHRNRTSVISASAVGVLTILLGLSLYMLLQPVRKPVTSIGVLPFFNVGQDPQSQYLSDGLTISLIDYLSRVPQLKVPGYNSVSSYDAQSIDSAVAAQRLQVNTLMLGRINSNGETLSIFVEIVDSRDNQTIWTKRFDGKVSDILSLQQQIAEDVSRSLGVTISGNATTLNKRPGTHNTEAYRLYLRGDKFWNLRTGLGVSRAIENFQGAIAQDPNYALAYTGLANSYALLGAYRELKPDETFPKARTAALKALELDSNLAEAHVSLAFISWLYEWDWVAAEQSFRRAIELRPGHVLAHHWYGLFLAEMGRFDEAIASEKRALELDPLSMYVNADLGRVYYYARRYDEALAQYSKAIEIGPNFGAFYAELGQLYEQTGDFEQYISTMFPELAHAEPRLKIFRERGREGYWHEDWKALSNRTLNWNDFFTMATICARLGKKDEAFENLHRAYEVRDHFMTQLKVEPSLDSLRSDPRFAELLERMKLAP